MNKERRRAAKDRSEAFLRSCLDSISLRPSQVGFAITETHYNLLGVPYLNFLLRFVAEPVRCGRLEKFGDGDALSAD
jgi:hypothetical protein